MKLTLQVFLFGVGLGECQAFILASQNEHRRPPFEVRMSRDTVSSEVERSNDDDTERLLWWNELDRYNAADMMGFVDDEEKAPKGPTIPVLKEMLKERGLKVSGSKGELLDRLDLAILAESSIDVRQYFRSSDWYDAEETYQWPGWKSREQEICYYPMPLLRGMVRTRNIPYTLNADIWDLREELMDLVMQSERGGMIEYRASRYPYDSTWKWNEDGNVTMEQRKAKNEKEWRAM